MEKSKFTTICPKCGYIHTGTGTVKKRRDPLTNKTSLYFDDMFDKSAGNSCKKCGYHQD